MVELEHFSSISPETIRQVRKKPAQTVAKAAMCIPPKASAEFVAAMEDILEIYQRPQDAVTPVVCVDETSKQQIQEIRHPLYRVDMIRTTNAGVSNLFMAPLLGFRHVEVTDKRTAVDFGHIPGFSRCSFPGG